MQKDMGVSLFVVQLGGIPDSAKPWKGLGSGVYELVEDHRAAPGKKRPLGGQQAVRRSVGVFFAAGPSLGKKRPLGGQQAVRRSVGV